MHTSVSFTCTFFPFLLYLSKQGHTPVKVQSDGNCLIRAISAALTGNQAYYLQLRQVPCTAAFEAHEQLVLNGLHETINTSKFVDHIKSVSQNGVWGTNVEIIAAATLFKNGCICCYR